MTSTCLYWTTRKNSGQRRSLSWRQVKAEKESQVESQERRLKELAPAVKNMERLAADFSDNPEEILPEPGTLETGRAYREKMCIRDRVYCEVHPYGKALDKIKELSPIGIIFTGGPNSVYAEGAPMVDPAVFQMCIRDRHCAILPTETAPKAP